MRDGSFKYQIGAEGEVISVPGPSPQEIEQLRATTLSNPGDVAAHRRLGRVLQLTGDFEGAAEEYRTVAGIQPESTFAHTALGHNLLELGRIEEALRAFEEA